MKTFEQDIKAFKELFVKRSAKALELFTVSFIDKLTSRTPIGKPEFWKYPPPPGYVPGTLINSWVATLNFPAPIGQTRQPDTSGSSSKRQVVELSKKALGEVMYIANPARYAYRIEFDGWSWQAPSGMLGITAVENMTRFSKAVRDAKRN